jgi:hypothetical protein
MEEERFTVWLFNPNGPGIRELDGGKREMGLTEDELRQRLANEFELTVQEIESLIGAARARTSTSSQ